MRERQHSRVLKQLRVVIRLQAEISLDDKNSATGLEEGASRATEGGAAPGTLTSMPSPHGAIKLHYYLLVLLSSHQSVKFAHLEAHETYVFSPPQILFTMFEAFLMADLF